MSKYGIPLDQWDKAKQEARNVLVDRAKSQEMITYSDLATRITTVSFDPHGRPLSDLIGEISKEEDEAGRGMLSAIVIHKDGDNMPGNGFFEYAKTLGRDTSDKIEFWSNEVKTVLKQWSKH